MYILDKFSVILEGYHELCQVDESLSRAHVVQNFAKVLHRQWDVKRTPGPAQGAELLFRVLLENEICKCVSNINQFIKLNTAAMPCEQVRGRGTNRIATCTHNSKVSIYNQ